ncbi:MAG: hypothetical protein ABSH28_09075 [Acidobacteriota bacterium]|jgi:hypothetical protein
MDGEILTVPIPRGADLPDKVNGDLAFEIADTGGCYEVTASGRNPYRRTYGSLRMRQVQPVSSPA